MALYPNADLIRSFFAHNGQQYRVVQFRGGKLEVYLCEQGTGLELWQGYCHEVDIDLGNAAYDAFQGAPGQRWLIAG